MSVEASAPSLLVLAEHVEVTREVPRPSRLKLLALRLGLTRWASPPPATSWREVAVLVALGDIGLLLMVWSLGGLGP